MRHSGKTKKKSLITVNIAVLPLYVPHDYISFGFSDRVGCLICDKDIWWDYSDASICEKKYA